MATEQQNSVGASEMQERIYAFDWSQTPLGPLEAWSPALRTMVRILLANGFPHVLWWGPDYIQLYNDAYRRIPGTKHPHKALGRPAHECWSEIWHIIGPLIDRPFKGGPPSWNDDICLEINRHGFVEESHFTIAYSPAPDETVESGIGGVLATVHEITEKVVSDRRVAALRDLGARSVEAKTAEEACALAAETLAAHAKDIPFALLYLIDSDRKTARLAGSVGVAAGARASPATCSLQDDSFWQDDSLWPLAAAMRGGSTQAVTELTSRLAGDAPPGPWSDPPNAAVVAPIRSNKAGFLAGFLVAGVSARLKLDQSYLDFLDLAASQIAASIANAREFEAEKKRAEALAEIDRAKTVFFSNVSHEFRTPLTLMLGPIEELLTRARTALSPAAKSQLEVTQRNGLRLLRLVNTLLDFSRIEAGRVRAVFEPTDLAAFTAELASVFRAATEKAALRLSVDCPRLSEPVYVDREMWEKVVLNLVSNAFKFTFEGEIAVSLRATDKIAELRVRDTGVGIAEEEMPRLFERFHRAPNVRSRTHEGSGIGLALVQELIKLHGGWVRAESRLGEGSTFIVGVPLGKAHLPPEQVGGARALGSTSTGAAPFVEEALLWVPDDAFEREAETLPKNELLPTPCPAGDVENGRPRLLVADDNADMRQYLTRILAESYDVQAAPDGEAALSAARQRRPDLILSDVMMPNLDGFGLLRELRADPGLKTIPVILLSARAGEESRVEGMQEGADDYVVKPFSARELLARVAAHLDLARLRKQAQEALRESEKRFRALVEASSNAVYRMGADWSEMRHLMGRDFIADTQEPSQSWLQKYVHPDEQAHVMVAINEAIRTKSVFEMEHGVLRADGGIGWMHSRAVPILDASGEITEWFGMANDISARKEAEKALREADRRKDEFLATLAHELRNPLTPIRNGLLVLRRSGGQGETAEHVEGMMERQLDYLVRLVDDLLEVSRISRGKIELVKTRVELATIIKHAVEMTRELFEKKNLELSVALPDGPLLLDADAVRLTQVFANLLNNAAKYTDQGRIEIGAEREASEVVVNVADTGVGIAKDMLPRVFDLFVQARERRDRSQGGLGIGLALVRSLVELHGGTVDARSEGEGRGCCFVVRLPSLVTIETKDQALMTTASETQAKTRRRVLVVDDSPDVADSLALLLKTFGAEVRVAHSGAEGLTACAEFAPELIFLDIGMPVLDGLETARRMRELPSAKKATLVALTGWGEEETRRRAKQAGFDRHVTKPADLDELQALLDLVPQS